MAQSLRDWCLIVVLKHKRDKTDRRVIQEIVRGALIVINMVYSHLIATW